MERDYIRRKTALIIEKDGYFLQGMDIAMDEPIWTRSRYDAWRTRERADAALAAHRLQGRMWLFNPLVGQSWPVDVLRRERA